MRARYRWSVSGDARAARSGRDRGGRGRAGCGAVATFIGLVRDHNAGRRVLYLDYECYEPLAVKSFQRIAAEAAERWPGVRLAIDHRVGPLQIGEASVVIAAASAHRAEAFAACRYAIERIKQIAPIWKHEHFEGGDVWIEGATADPDNEDARRGAGARGDMTARSCSRTREAARMRVRSGCSRGCGTSPATASSNATPRPARRPGTCGMCWPPSTRAWRRTQRSSSCAVNEEYAKFTRPLQDGDEVAFLPPVSGG